MKDGAFVLHRATHKEDNVQTIIRIVARFLACRVCCVILNGRRSAAKKRDGGHGKREMRAILTHRIDCESGQSDFGFAQYLCLFQIKRGRGAEHVLILKRLFISFILFVCTEDVPLALLASMLSNRFVSRG